MAQQLGWIGLGNMGRGMCKNLAEKGKLSKPLLIYNRTTSRAEDLSSKVEHTEVSTSATDLVRRSDIIFLCLGDDDAVLSNIQAVIDEVKDLKGKLVVDCSTIHPDNTMKEKDMVTSAGASFVACPVFGAPAMADSGQLVCVLAGPAEAVEKIKPYCKGVMGRANIDLSDQEPGKATLLKIIGNTFILSMVETLSEGFVVAEKSGLGVEQLRKFVEVMFPGPYTAYTDRMLKGDYYQRDEPLFAAYLARKDARHAKNIAKEAGMEMKNVELADHYLESVDKLKGKKGDLAGMYGAKRVEAGLEYGNQE